MAEEKRKTKTSTAVKTRYNEKVYDVIRRESRKSSRRLSARNAQPRAYRKHRLSKRR